MGQEFVWNAFELVTAVLEAVIYFWFMGRIAERMRNRTLWLVSHFLFAGSLFFCDMIQITSSLKLVYIIILGGMLSHFVYQIESKKIVVGSMAWFVITIACETVVMGILMSIHGQESAQVFLEETAIRFQALFMAKIVLVFCLGLMIRCLQPMKSRYTYKELLLIGIQLVSFAFATLMIIEVSIASKGTYEIPPYSFSILALICLGAYFVSFKLTENYFMARQEREEYLKMQSMAEKQLQYYEMKKEESDQLRRMYHDLKSHLSAIELMQNEDASHITEYMEEMHNVVKTYATYYDSGNTVVDMLLQDKKKEAERQNIEMSIMIEKGILNSYKSFFLCIIFSNALDNAMRAVGDNKKKERIVRVKTAGMPEGVSILFCNTYYGKIITRGKRYLSTKSNASQHGMGLVNIEEAVMRCGGRMNILNEEGEFSLYILLPWEDNATV